MNISREQYEADIRAAKVEALREQARRMDKWHTRELTGDAWDQGYLHAVDQIIERADEIEAEEV